MQNQATTKQNKMGVMPIKKLLLTMAIPLMLSLVVQSLYNIVDSIFVARLSEKALTATSLAYPVQILMIALSVGTGVGINALISRLLGAGKREEVGKAAATGIVLALISSALFMVAGLIAAAAWSVIGVTLFPRFVKFMRISKFALVDNRSNSVMKICHVVGEIVFVQIPVAIFISHVARHKFDISRRAVLECS